MGVVQGVWHHELHGCLEHIGHHDHMSSLRTQLHHVVLLVLFDEWLTLAIPSLTTFPLNVGMEDVATFSGVCHHTFK
jgi:hypothetical protein